MRSYVADVEVRACKGSAMGYLHSSDLMDLVFYWCVERQLIATRCTARHGVKLYRRFRDDILVWLDYSSYDLGKRWLRALFKTKKFFRLEVDNLAFNKVK